MYVVLENGIPTQGFYEKEDALDYVHVNHLSEDDIYQIEITG